MKNRHIFIPTIFISVLIILLTNCFVRYDLIYISNSTGLYLFSALLQSNAAILSIAGVFFIFRIQNYQSDINTLKHITMRDPGVHSTPTQITNFDNLSLDGKKQAVNDSQYSNFISQLLRDWVNNIEKIEELKHILKVPVIFISIGLILNTIGLIFASHIHHYSKIVEFNTFYLIFVYQFLIIVILIRSISNALEL